MTVRKVKDAISHVRSVVKEWQEIGATWEEEHTRYALIDPIIRALDWDTGDPKQCHPEFPRGRQKGCESTMCFLPMPLPRKSMIWN